MPDEFEDPHDPHDSNQADDLASFAHYLEVLERSWFRVRSYLKDGLELEAVRG